MVVRYVAVGLVALSLAGAASAEKPSSRELRQTSWGKPGVSLEEYRMDAGICAWRATNIDIADTEPAKVMVKASRALDHPSYTILSYTNVGGTHMTGAGTALDMRNVEDRFRVDKQFDAVADMQYDALYACLKARGYRKFQLTDDQVKQLRRLRQGTLKRHLYLHQLASDPAVLSRQAL